MISIAPRSTLESHAFTTTKQKVVVLLMRKSSCWKPHEGLLNYFYWHLSRLHLSSLNPSDKFSCHRILFHELIPILSPLELNPDMTETTVKPYYFDSVLDRPRTK
jgi:hypothetical protein